MVLLQLLLILQSSHNWDNLLHLPHCQNHQKDFPQIRPAPLIPRTKRRLQPLEEMGPGNEKRQPSPLVSQLSSATQTCSAGAQGKLFVHPAGFRIGPFWASCGGFFLKVLQGLSQQDWAAKGRLIFLPVLCMAWHESVCNVSWCMDVIAKNPAREPRAVFSTGCHPLLNTKCTRVLVIPSQTSLIPSRMDGAQIF